MSGRIKNKFFFLVKDNVYIANKQTDILKMKIKSK